jgi:predicted dehydrogenase
MPNRWSSHILSTLQGDESQDKVPGEFRSELDFPNGTSGSFYCSFITQNQQWAHISGTAGSVRLDDFVLPFFGSRINFETSQPQFDVRGCSFHMKQKSESYHVDEYDSGFAPAQEINMFECFHQIVETGKLDPTWGEICLKTQKVMDTLWQSARQSL